MKRRIIAMLMAIAMLVGNIPVQAFATEAEPQETLACMAEGCTYGAGHSGECSTFVACGKDGCTYAADHEGNCSTYVAPEEPRAEAAADATVYVTVSNRGQLGMAYEEVTVSDINQDGRLTVDEALYAAHSVYGKGYASDNGTVTKLWDEETSNISFFLNHNPLSTDVSADTVSDGDYLVASVDQDTANDYDKYSRFNMLETSAKAGEDFILTLTDDAGNALAGMEIGLWSGSGTNMTGQTTDVSGSVTLNLDQEGLYCVTARGTVVESSIDVDTLEMTSIETPIIAPVCVVKVTGHAQQPLMVTAEEVAVQASAMDNNAVSTVAEGDTDLSVSGATVNMAPDSTVGSLTLTSFEIYKQNAYPEAPAILSATQNGTTVNVVLAEDTEPSYPLQLGFASTGSGVLRQSGNTCTLSAGQGSMSVLLQLYPGYGAPQPTAQSTYTVNFSIPMGTAYTVTPPTGEGFTFTGKESVYEGKDYTFTVSVNEGYDGSDMEVKVNGEDVTGNDGSYTVSAVSRNLEITVEGIVKKELCTITLTEGEGYTISSDDTPYKGEDYTFTVTPDSVNYKADTLQVLVDGEEITGENGVYTIPALQQDHVVTMTLAKKAVYTVTKNSQDGVTITGADTVLETDPYTFRVAVDNAYDNSGMKVLVNEQEVALQEDGSYTIESAAENITVTVTGVEAKVIYTVTLTEGKNYTISGQATSYAGEPYTFIVTVDDAIYKADDILVKVNEEAVTLTEGKYTIETLAGDTTVTVENVVERQLFTVTKPETEGVTVTGEGTVREGKPYTFSVAVNDGYDGTNLQVTVNEEAVTLTDGSYTVESVSENLTIAVSGVSAKVLCNITLPAGKGYTISGAAAGYAGDSYSFTVSVNPGYNGDNMTVTVNGSLVSGTDGTYTTTLEGDTAVEVTGVERVALPTTELTVSGNVIDITDRTVYSLVSSIYAKATNIQISGATVLEAYENGTTVYVILDQTTADAAEIGVTFGTSLARCTMEGTTGSVVLSGGEGSKTMTLTGKYSNNRKGTATYTIIFFREEPSTTPPVLVKSADTAEVYQKRTLTLNLEEYFTDADSYYLVTEAGNTALEGSTYSITPSDPGTLTLVFAAANEAGESPDKLTVTVTVKEIVGGIWLNYTTSNGSVNYVTFTDANGNSIDGMEISCEGKKISVVLPKTYDLSGTVTATFNRTANDSGLPFLSSSNAFNHGTGSRVDVYTNTLNSGAATRHVYLYNAVPKAVSNVYETITISYAIKNDLPVLSEGVSAAAEATITAGENYTLDLSPLFTDADADALTYLVSIDGAAAVAADASYSYTTDTAGTYTLVFTANDGKGTSTATYTVTLTVKNSEEKKSMTVRVPEGLEPSFYVSTGYGEDGLDMQDAAIQAEQGQTAEGLTAYTLGYPANVSLISVRTEGWGGMAFDAEADSTAILRQVQFSVKDYEGNAAESTNAVTYEGHTAPAGTNGWLLVTGTEYTYQAVPADTASLTTATKTETLEAAAEVYTLDLTLGMKDPITITVTTGAKAQLYKYDTNRYYVASELAAKIIQDNEDGTTTYSFVGNTKESGSCFIYRVSMPGKITKAGYLKWGQQSIAVTHAAEDKSNTYRLDDYSGTGQANSGLAEDSVVLNVNGQNHLAMNVGESKTLKAYRVWEIIKISYQNYIITPDFTFQILSGSDVISLTEKDSPSVGEGDWMTLTALKEGTAVIEVTYDAMEVAGGSYDGIYGATDPARTGLVIVQVGGNDTSVDFGIDGFSSRGTSYSDHVAYNENAKSAWDAEFDTLYFTGSSGQLKLSPTASGAITQVAVSHNKGGSWTVLTAEDGIYTAPIASGNNILRITTETGVAYQVVRGDKVSVQVTEQTGDGDGRMEPGETVRVALKGLHMPIPKMAGNYNPGFVSNNDGYSPVHLNYTANGQAVYGPGSQYTFITAANYLDIAIPEDIQTDKLTLTDGYIGVGVLGLTQFDVGGDSHRNIPDSGCTTRDSKTTFHTRSILPDITVSLDGVKVPVPVTGVTLDKTELTLNVGDTETLTATVDPANADNKKVTWSSDDLTVARAVDGSITAVSAGTTTVTVTTEDGSFTATCEVTVKQPVESVSVTPESAEVEVGKTVELTAAVLPEDASDKTVTWKSSDETVATVENGVVTGVKEGTVTITTAAGEKTAACTVTVTEAQQETPSAGIDIETGDVLSGSFDVRASNIHVGAAGSVVSNTISADGNTTVLIMEDVQILDISLDLIAKNKMVIKKAYVAVNDGTPEIAQTINETAVTAQYTTTITPDWSNGDMVIKFTVGMYNSGAFKNPKEYTLTLKKAGGSAENTAPQIAENAIITASAEQYSWYELDLGTIFDDAETQDSSLFYKVKQGEAWNTTDQNYSILIKESGTKELIFTATDEAGATSDAHTVTLQISEYQAPEHGLLIGNVTDNGVLKSLTIQNAEGTVLPVEFEVYKQAITVYLPGDQVGANDTVKAVFDLEQVNGLPFLSSYYQANSAKEDRLNVFETQLNSYSGSVTAYYWTEEPGTTENRNGYTITYQKLVGENQAPALADGVEATVMDSIAQYQTWSVDLSKIFTEPDEEAMTYTVSVNNGAAKDTDASYSYECSESGTVNFVFKAADPSGLTATYKVTLTVTPVPRTVVSTELTDETANGVFCKAIQVTGYDLTSRVTHYAADQHKITFLLQSAEDDASVELEFLSDFQSVMYYYASQSGEPTLELSEKVNGPYTVTLANGEKILYLATTTAAKNERQDYQMIFRNWNNVPVPVQAGASDNCTVQVPYAFNLNDKFTDQDADSLDYYVSVQVGGNPMGEKQTIDAEWEYTAGTTGEHTLVFTVSDGFVDSEPYTVTLNAELSEDVYTVNIKLPEAVTPAFYITDSVSGESGDVLGDALNTMPGETADGWTTYQVIIPDNISRISIRGTTTENEETVDWGGMSIVTKDADGNAITDTLVLRQVKGVIDSQFDGKAPVEADAKFVIQTQDGEYPVSGSAYEEGGYLTYRYLLVAQEGYTYSTVATGSLAEKYGTKVCESTYSLTTDEVDPATLKLFIDLKNGMYVTVPQGSVVHTGKMSNYFKYYFFDEYYRMEENADGTVTYIFEVPAKANPDGTLGGEEFIRVQHPRGVTYWTYDDMVLTAGGKLTLTEDDLFIGSSFNSKSIIHDLSEIPTDVADIYLSINGQMYLDLDAGESYKFNVFRNWQAIEGMTNKKTALPDVHYTVISPTGSASDVVTVTTDPYNSSMATVTANKVGTAIVLVTYDAMYSTQVCSDAAGYSGEAAKLSAIWPENTGVFVVSVGADGSSIVTNIDVDAEHDPIYYVGNAGAELSFTPDDGCTVSVARAIVGTNSLTYGGFSTNGVKVNSETGEVTVTGLKQGRHIISVEKDGVATYQVVTTKQTSYTITDAQGNVITDKTPVLPGTELTIQFGDLYNPVNKLAGVYNSNCALYYKGEDGTVFEGSNGDTVFGFYVFAAVSDLHKITVTVPSDWTADTYTLEGSFKIGGFGGGGGGHRGILLYETGRNVNNEAEGASGNPGALPTITIPVTAQIPAEEITLNSEKLELQVGETADLVAEIKPANSTDEITWQSSDPEIATVEDGKVTAVGAGTATITVTTKDGEKTDTCEVTVKQPEQPEIPEREATIYFSFSHDDKFKTTDTGKVMALQKVTVPYFDLTPYGLGNFNLPQSHADYGQPTMFHLYIYATEVFQYGVSPDEAGKGYLKDYIGSEMFAISGTPGSVCMDYIWGENMNLNYYHNYIYPADETGYGITADRVPLKNGDIVTIGHFTSWSFFSDPTSIFNYLVADKDTVVTSALQSDALSLQVYRAGPNLGGGGSNTPRAAALDIYYVKADALTSGDVTTWTKLGTTDATGKLTVDLSDWSLGQYILAVAGQKGEKYPNDIVSTPGGIVLNVNEDPQVRNVIGMIDAIGEVTLNSEGVITATDDAFNALTKTQQLLVTNRKDLADAKQKLAELKSDKEDRDAVEAVKKLIDAIDKKDPNYQQQIQEALDAFNELNEHRKDLLGEDYAEKVTDAKTALTVMQKIDAIGDIALDEETEKAIEDARKAYDDLTDEQKDLVNNYDDLNNAEAKLKDLKDEAEAQKVIDMIKNIGEDVTLGDEETIADALEAYDDLTDEQKKLVDNHDDLISADAKLNVLKDKEEAKKVNDLIEKIGEDVTLDDEGTIQEALEAYEGLTDAQKEYVNYDELKNAQEDLWCLKLSNAEIFKIYTTTRDYLAGLGAPGVGSTDGEWRVIGLKRSGEDVADAYYDAVVAYVQKNIQNGRLHTEKSSDNSRIILALTALGKDITNVGGHNLLSGLNEMSYISYQGINGVIWALIAFDSHNYPTPAGVTREELVDAILTAQLSDGGWALAGEAADPDITGMALQALAPYYGSNEQVKAAVDEALDMLSGTQNSDGTFSGSEGTTCESLAQVVTALTALGIDPETDERFVKNNVSALNALAAFYVNDGGFKHGLSTDRNMMATEQGFYALVSYYRYKDGKTALYDMSDVTLDKDAAAGVVALINAIGTVDLTKEDEIGAARTAYNALTDAQKELVTNYKTLTDAEIKLAQLMGTPEDREKATAVKALIDAIGIVNSVNQKDEIENACNAYNRLTTLQRNLVGADYYEKLLNAVEALEDLEQAATDADAVMKVIELIKKIDTNKNKEGVQINSGSATAIQTARNAYNNLRNDTLRGRVTNRQDLFDAEEAWEVLNATVSVTFSLLGCYDHSESTVHTLAGGNLQTWIAAKTYKVQPGATVKDLFEQALRAAGLTWKNLTGNYVESITRNGVTIGEFTNGAKSGWMYTLNGKHPGLGVNQQTLVSGDKVIFHYSDDYTREEGNPSSSGTTTGGTTGSTGTVSGYTNYITTTTTTVNTETAESVDRLIEDIGEEITLDSEAKILAARAAYDKLTDAQKELVEKYDVLVAAEAALAQLKGEVPEDIYLVTGDYLQNLGTPGVGTIGGEWMVIGLARSGRNVPTGYYDHVLNYVRENINEKQQLHSAKSSDNSRLILALTSIGKDVTDVDGHNLLQGLSDMDYVRKQGINGPIWALMAFDSGNYPVPVDGNVSREALIRVILEAQLSDGGWALSGERSDPDMTGMAIQALAPYMDSNLDVKKAVETAIWTLSKLQNDNGSFSSVDGPNSESIAQVIVALSALGIDADTDARFVKNGISALDALASYYIPGGGFRHILDGNLDGMSTEQAYYALAAYNRMLQNQTFLYDMTDVIDAGGDVIVEETTEPTGIPTEPVEQEEEGGNAVVIWTGIMSICAAAIALLLLNRKKLFGKF